MATYLSRSFTADNTSRSIFTVSAWIKRSVLSSAQTVISASTTSNFNDKIIGFRSDNTLEVNNVASGSAAIEVITNRVFRDTSAWYHIVVAIDTTQSAIADGVKLYVNGVRDTDFSGSPTYTQSATFEIGRNGSATAIGRYESGSSQYFGGYIADVHYIDGQQKLPTDFGETDSTTGEWKPKSYAGTYGNNGFLLEFKNAGSLGTDTSGNSETFTVNSAGTGAQVTDTPSNLFCTYNFLQKASNVTLSEGNLKAAIAGSGQSRSTVGNIAVSKGKWYWEVKYTTDVVSGFIGLVSADIAWNINATTYPSSGVTDNVGFNDGGTKYVNGSSSSYGSGFGNNDVIGVAANLDDNEVIFYVNGTAQNSGTAISKTFSGDYLPVVQHQSSSGTSNFQINFGNPSFTISSGNADAAGHGNFEYAVPSGHFALCTKNLNTYG
tara:strand:+ start:283 stop:1590 length:1308 start_codon:yes stop_codon:yes gene_type:complete